MKNPKDFKKGDVIIDVYSNRVYEVIEPDKHGMAKLKIENYTKVLNAYNNPRFEKADGQLSLAFNN